MKTSAELAAHLDQVRRSAADALIEIGRLEAQKLEVEDFAEVEQIDKKIGRHRWDIARSEKKIETLKSQYADVSAKERRELFAHLTANYAPLLREFLIAAEATITAFHSITDIINQLELHQFRNALGEFKVPPNLAGHPLLSDELLVGFRRFLETGSWAVPHRPATPSAAELRAERKAASKRGRPEPLRLTSSPRPVVAKNLDLRAPEEPIRTVSSRRVALDEWPDANPKRLRSPDDVAALEPGQVRARVLRSGYSCADDQPACDVGQIIRLPSETARNAALNGAIEVVAEEQPSETAPAENSTQIKVKNGSEP